MNNNKEGELYKITQQKEDKTSLSFLHDKVAEILKKLEHEPHPKLRKELLEEYQLYASAYNDRIPERKFGFDEKYEQPYINKPKPKFLK